METILLSIIGGVILLYIIVMVPLQYQYISEMKAIKNKTHKTQNEIYDNMSFEEQQLHYNLQGSLINLPSSLIAMLIYKIVHPQTK